MPQRMRYYSEEAQEILGKIPSWIIRWGIVIIAAIFIGIMIGCYFIKYPKIVHAQISITTLNPPSDLVARQAGLIDSICVVNGQKVNKDDLLVILTTPAKYNNILKIKFELNQSMYQDFSDIVCQDWIEAIYVLGDLQVVWGEFQRQALYYRHYISIDYIGEKKNLLSSQIDKSREYYNNLKRQSQLLQEELSYDIKLFQRDSILLSRSVISSSDYEISAKNLIAKQSNYVGFEATLSSTELSILQTKQKLIELTIQEQNERSEYERSLSKLRQQLLAEISQWCEQYVIVSPVAGCVSLQKYWSRNQNVNIGDVLASVDPDDELSIIGRMKVPSTGFGMVKRGQIVNVKLNGFPYMEYGVLRGVISSISSVPEQVRTQTGGTVTYMAEVIFPNILTTTYKKELPMIQQMDGTAEIITEDMRLIEQFIQPIISIFKN